jgi:hypothetical protein
VQLTLGWVHVPVTLVNPVVVVEPGNGGVFSGVASAVAT